MASVDHEVELITSGEFSRRTHLTRKALRHYDEIGLLSPEAIDDSSAYRLYSSGQVDTARLLGLLRGTDMSLDDIGSFLADLLGDTDRALDRLGDHRRKLEGDQASSMG